jgi:2'-5' RNA ligase
MRLFIAINFNTLTIDRLAGQQKAIKEKARRGNFSHRDNLHLTLAFIGERPIEDVAVFKEIIDALEIPAFQLELDHVGFFSRNGSDIWWVGVAKNPALEALQHTVAVKLRSAGFPVESRRFTAHITLARETRLKRSEDRNLLAGPIKAIQTMAKRVSLMESTRIDGRLTYIEIYGKDLPKK